MRYLLAFLVLLGSIAEVRADLITGQILLPDGKPAANAEAWIHRADNEDSPNYLPLSVNEAGVFQEELQPSPYSSSYFGRILVLHPGCAPSGGGLKKDKNVFQLKPAVPVNGMIVDEDNKPVAGVKVRLSMISERDSSSSVSHIWLGGFPGSDRLTAVSDEKGKWQLNAGFENSDCRLVVEDDRYQRHDIQAVPGQEAVTTVLLGATLAGRVVHENGQPAEGIRVWAQAQSRGALSVSWGDSKSAADGSFELRGLSNASYNICVEVPDQEWVAQALQNVVAKPGKTVALNDLILVKGAIVEGRVTDEQGQPIKGVSIGSYGPHRPASSAAISSDTTDEKGFYRLRVSQGENQIYISGKPAAYLGPERGSSMRTLSLLLKENETRQQNFVLKRGMEVKGKFLDKTGQPVRNVHLQLMLDSQKSYEVSYVNSDEDGNWKAVGLVPGRWIVLQTDEWELVGNAAIEVPHTGDLELRLQPTEYHSVRGKAVSYDGQPLAGVQVKFEISVPQGRFFTGSQRTVVSNNEGIFEVDKLVRNATVKVFSVQKSGYLFSKGGGSVKGRRNFDLDDIVMVAHKAKLAGRVIDADKQPVEGVRISSPAIEAQAPVITDKDGSFQLEKLAQGFVQILALHPEKGVAVARFLSDGSDVELQLTPVSPNPGYDQALAVAMIEETVQLRDARFGVYDWAILLPHDFDLAIQRSTNAEGKLPDDIIRRAISYLVRTDLEKALVWGLPRLDDMTNIFSRSQAIGQLGVALVNRHPEVTRELYDRLMAEEPAAGYERSVPLVNQAKLAAALKLPETSELAEKALAQAKTMGEENRGYEAMVAGALAEADFAQMKRILEKLEGSEKINGLMRAVETMISHKKFADVPAYAELLDSWPGVSDGMNSGLGIVAVQLIPVLGPSDPAAALALARRISNGYNKSQALAQAALWQETELKRALLQEAATAALAHHVPVAQLAQISIFTFAHFPDLSQEMAWQALALHQRSVSDVQAWQISGREDSIRNLAVALSLHDRLKARELLEFEWLALQGKSKAVRPQGYEEERIALAMAGVDFERARQMARSIPEDSSGMNYRANAMNKLARWVLTAPEKRPYLYSQSGIEPYNDFDF